MKQLLFIALLLASFAAEAQITVTNSIFPTAGSVLRRSSTVNIGAATVTSPSATAQSWDFSYLTTDMILSDSILDASNGTAYASFPTTEILLPILGFGTSYVDISATAVTREGAGLEFFGISFVAPYSNPQTLQTANLTYNSQTNDTHSLRFAQNIDSVPFLRQFIDSLGLPVSPDSIRLNINGTTNLNVDAFGTCSIYDSTYNVLRQKVVIRNNVTIEVWVPAFGSGFWVDVTSTVSSQIPFPLSDTTYRYDFITEGEKVPVVSLIMDATGSTINSIEFLGNNPPTAIFQTALELANVEAFPNPVSEFIQLRTESLGVDAFQVQIVDVLGRSVRKTQNMTGHLNQISVAELPQGQYWLVLTSEQGKLLARKAISVVR